MDRGFDVRADLYALGDKAPLAVAIIIYALLRQRIACVAGCSRRAIT